MNSIAGATPVILTSEERTELESPARSTKTEIGLVAKSMRKRLSTSSNKPRIRWTRLHNLAAFGAGILREAPEHRMAAATRRAEVMCFAHAAALRLHRLSDPEAIARGG